MKYAVEVRKTKNKGRGVYALKKFKKGEVIERCPVLKLKPAERKHCEKTVLAHYIYPWRSLNDACAVMGYGWIYNHSYTPSAKWTPDYRKEEMVFKALRVISKGEEITVDYNGDYEPDEIDWFTVKS